MNILVISQYYYPEQFRINDICETWVERGHQVTVVTGIPNYPEGDFYESYGLFKRRSEIVNGVKVVRIPITPRKKGKIALIGNYLSFVISGYLWNLFSKENPDLVFIFEVSPMTQALPGVWFAKKKKIPCFLYVQDLWPENVEIIAGIKNQRILSGVGKMVDYIYHHCTKIFTTSESFVSAIIQRGVPKHKVLYWPQYAEDFYKPQYESEVAGISPEKFNVVFTGNIGVAQGLDILSEAASHINVEGNSTIHFVIVGDGRYKVNLQKNIQEMGLSHMFTFLPRQPANMIPSILGACDIAFLSLDKNPIFEMTIPAKLQSYMACGIPIIASASGETAKIIEESNAGICIKNQSDNELADAIMRLSELNKDQLRTLGGNARWYFEKHFNKTLLLDKMDEYLSQYYGDVDV